MEENNVEPEKKGMNTYVVLGLIAVIGIAGFILMNRNVQAPEIPVQTETIPSTSEQPIEQPESQTISDTITVDMEAGSFYFTPNKISVKKGQKVQINLTAKDMMHDFNIDELGVKSEIVKAGNSTVIEFTADSVGSFEYYCSVGEHRVNGQVGTLTVTE
jgi:nitrosocyanin